MQWSKEAQLSVQGSETVRSILINQPCPQQVWLKGLFVTEAIIALIRKQWDVTLLLQVSLSTGLYSDRESLIPGATVK